MKKKTDPSVEFITSTPESLFAEFTLLITDPATGKPKYGLRSKLINTWMRDYVESHRKKT